MQRSNACRAAARRASRRNIRRSSPPIICGRVSSRRTGPGSICTRKERSDSDPGPADLILRNTRIAGLEPQHCDITIADGRIAAIVPVVTANAPAQDVTAKLMKLPNYGIVVRNPADPVALDWRDRTGAVAEIARPLFGIKHGRRTFCLHRCGC
jgi:hypothetical protein